MISKNLESEMTEKKNVNIYPVGAKPHQENISSNLKGKYIYFCIPNEIHRKSNKKYKTK